MIFGLHYFLLSAGYSAVCVLLGPYFLRYTQASEFDLGLLFTILPTTVLTRPLISAYADRKQCHKQLLVIFLCCISLAYTPFVILPFILESSQPNQLKELLTPRIRICLLAATHVIGSVCFSGIRCLGDALAVNYAKRIDSNFTTYRKFGSLSFGICGFFLGKINTNGLLPDYTPSLIVFISCCGVLGLIIHLWPDEYFVMVCETNSDSSGAPPLPVGRELISRIGFKLVRPFNVCSCTRDKIEETDLKHANLASQQLGVDILEHKASKTNQQVGQSITSKPSIPLTAGQQLSILLLLMRRDLRIPMYLSVLFFGGMIGYAPQNFVFTYLEEVCQKRQTCNGAALSGLVMIGFCVTETLSYVTIATTRPRNFVFLLQIGLASYTAHYLFFAFVLDKVSPYFFLVEAMHGIEYSTSLSTSVELGYMFANEVVLLVPELIQRGLITRQHDQELVKVSLMATMNSCFTLIFEGAGTILGSFFCGLIVHQFSFNAAWTLSGCLAAFGFMLTIVVVLIGRFINWRPQIHEIALQTKQLNNS